MSALFIPGWGAPASLYRPVLPVSWEALEPPTFAVSRGSLAAYRAWLRAELRGRGRSLLGGHSMGAALAVFAAAEAPKLVQRLVLVAPAGLPLEKPMRKSAGEFVQQVGKGRYPLRIAAAAAAAVARAPRSALSVAREVRGLDLRAECGRLREAGVSALVVGCATDTLVTCDRSRELARWLGAEYREVRLDGGHMWMLEQRAVFADLLALR